jgi:predicted nucleotidyltransferase component of viral defense system
MILSPTFFEQVRLLVATLPQIHKEDCFVLKGGTAINLFIRDMPRLSVDIDLVYIPIENRNASLIKIDSAQKRIGENVARHIPGTRVTENRYTTNLIAIVSRSGEKTPLSRLKSPRFTGNHSSRGDS